MKYTDTCEKVLSVCHQSNIFRCDTLLHKIYIGERPETFKSFKKKFFKKKFP